MTRHPSHALLLAAAALLFSACAGTESSTSRRTSECDDSSKDCDSSDDFDDADDDSYADDDDDTSSNSGSKSDARVTRNDAGGSSTGGDASTGSTRRDSGTGSSVGGGDDDVDAGSIGGGGSEGEVPGDTETPPPSGGGTGSGPKVPEVTGTCPEFRSGTATIGGLGGISMQVGAKKQGTGSLVFYWHGTGSSSFESRMFAGTSEVLAQGGIVVAPSGSTRTGGDCSGTGTFSKDDMKVADLIYACAVKNHGIDPKRVYTTGCSAGGLQAGCFAALRSSYVAAAVPNSGGIVFPQAIQDKNNIPAIMTMHGGPGDVVIVTFSQTSATLDRQMKTAGGFVVNCNHGGGHCGAPGPLQQAGWTFMKAHPFGTKPSPYAGGLPSGFPSYCKVF
ncbi:MAG: PHB depolymerase family esterase [Polyangiales bacterium]